MDRYSQIVTFTKSKRYICGQCWSSIGRGQQYILIDSYISPAFKGLLVGTIYKYLFDS